MTVWLSLHCTPEINYGILHALQKKWHILLRVKKSITIDNLWFLEPHSCLFGFFWRPWVSVKRYLASIQSLRQSFLLMRRGYLFIAQMSVINIRGTRYFINERYNTWSLLQYSHFEVSRWYVWSDQNLFRFDWCREGFEKPLDEWCPLHTSLWWSFFFLLFIPLNIDRSYLQCSYNVFLVFWCFEEIDLYTKGCEIHEATRATDCLKNLSHRIWKFSELVHQILPVFFFSARKILILG